MGIFRAIGNGFKITNQNWKIVLLFFGFYLLIELINLLIQNKLLAPLVPIQTIPITWRLLGIGMIVIGFFAGIFIYAGLLNFVKETIKKGQALFQHLCLIIFLLMMIDELLQNDVRGL